MNGIEEYIFPSLSGLLFLIVMIYYFKIQKEYNTTHKQVKEYANYVYPTFTNFKVETLRRSPRKTLKEVADNLSSEFVFLISSEGEISYLRNANPNLKIKDIFIKKDPTEEVFWLDTGDENDIPELLRKNKVTALIDVAIGFPNTVARLIICTNRKLNKDHEVHYNTSAINLAMIMGRALPAGEVKEMIKRYNSSL